MNEEFIRFLPQATPYWMDVNREPDNLSSYNDIAFNGRESIGGNTDFAIVKTTYRCGKALGMIKTLFCLI